MSKVIVVGAGVVGLSTALQLRSLMPSLSITVMADKFTEDTTSHGAAGIFRPSTSFSGPDPATTRRWIVDSYEFYKNLLSEPGAGVSKTSGYIFSSVSPSLVRNSYLEGLVDEYRPCSQEELKLCPGDWKYGSYFTTLLIQSKYFLPWATHKLKSNGVEFLKRRVERLEELKGDCDIVVNCSGLGSRELANDARMVPIRGQLFKVEAKWLDKFYYGDFDTYIIPTGDGICTVGGSRHYESYSTQPCQHDGAAIMERAVKMLPNLAEAKVIQTWVGLRPHRYEVRVESEIRGGMKIVHNYGHGGYGVTTAPGTSRQAIGLIQLFINHRSQL